MSKIYSLLLSGFFMLFLLGCSQNEDSFGNLVKDNRPVVPVTFEGATTYGFNPYLLLPLSKGTDINIKLNIPANSGRTIKEITRVAVGTTSIQPGSINSATGVYLKTGITGNGTTASVSTNIAEIRSKYPTLNLTAGTPYREIRFIFLVTLDNGDQIIPVPLDVRISQ